MMNTSDSFFQWLYKIPLSGFTELEEKVTGFGKLLIVSEKKIGFLFIMLDDFAENQLDNLLSLIDEFNQRHIQILCIWEDIWMLKQELVRERISTLLGISKRIHGRATKVRKITKPELATFLLANHLQVPTQAKYKYGLFYKEQLVAVCSFSSGTPMPKRGENYKSYELIRFASLCGYTVVGGLSKLLKHFIEEIKPSDIMTYADRDWSVGKGYNKLGFRLEGITPPQYFWVKKGEWVRYYPARLPDELKEKAMDETEEQHLNKMGFVKVFNSGNLKFRLVL